MTTTTRSWASRGLLGAATCLCFALAAAARPAGDGPSSKVASDDEAIRQVIANLDDAWLKGDAKAWCRDYLPDAQFVNILGTVLDGVPAIEKRHAEIFETIFKGSRLISTVRKVRYLSPTSVVVETDLDHVGYKALPPGIAATVEGVLKTRMKHVLIKQDGKWRIVASQNTAVAPRKE
jgi:uncharacterized protein (TIGR02246 family)